MLAEKLRVLLATLFSYKIQAQFYHWNVTSQNFQELHNFFGDVYTAADADIDTTAELIRTLNLFAPASLNTFLNATRLNDGVTSTVKGSVGMLSDLIKANDEIFLLLTETYDVAEEEKNRAVSNVIQDFLTANRKQHWMIKSFMGV